MVASSYTLAATVCALAVSWLGMPLGRRGCIVMGDVLVIAGGILQASSWSVPQIIVGRVICVSSFVGQGSYVSNRRDNRDLALAFVYPPTGQSYLTNL